MYTVSDRIGQPDANAGCRMRMRRYVSLTKYLYQQNKALYKGTPHFIYTYILIIVSLSLLDFFDHNGSQAMSLLLVTEW